MRVLTLPRSGEVYSANCYLVLGSWSRIEDVNTLVDVGRDRTILDGIRRAPTGVGKSRIERIVLTHSHYDHAELLPWLKEIFHPEVFAMSPLPEGADKALEDGEILHLGDESFEVIKVHAHSQDSICLLSEKTGALFSGDAPILLNANPGSFEPGFKRTLERLCRHEISVIYPGHGEPLTQNCQLRLRASLALLQ